MGFEVLAIVLLAILGIASVYLFVAVLRRLAWGVRMARGPLPPTEPIPDPNPPAPVSPTVGVRLAAWGGLLWALAHFGAVAFWWGTGYLVARSFSAAVSAVYLCWAGLTTAIGCVMLLHRQPYGRRAVSLGQFLFILWAFMGLAISLLLPRLEKLPEALRQAAPILTFSALAHLGLDTLIGSAAQWVGRPASWAPPPLWLGTAGGPADGPGRDKGNQPPAGR
jgi:hypothetical protein